MMKSIFVTELLVAFPDRLVLTTTKWVGIKSIQTGVNTFEEL